MATEKFDSEIEAIKSGEVPDWRVIDTEFATAHAVVEILEGTKCPNCDALCENGRCTECNYGNIPTRAMIYKLFHPVKSKVKQNKKLWKDKHEIFLDTDSIVFDLKTETGELNISFNKNQYTLKFKYNEISSRFYNDKRYFIDGIKQYELFDMEGNNCTIDLKNKTKFSLKELLEALKIKFPSERDN